MNRLVYKFNFSKHVPVDDIEDSLMVAALATEALHGRGAMKLDASFSFNKNTYICIVDAETQVGRDIAQILTTFLTKGYGESSFKVEQTREKCALLCAIGAMF